MGHCIPENLYDEMVLAMFLNIEEYVDEEKGRNCGRGLIWRNHIRELFLKLEMKVESVL
jgi:hypothetical protein